MKLIFFLLTFLFLNIAAAQTCSTDVCVIANNATVDVTRHSLCSRVTNTTGADFIVPTKASSELSSFIAGSPRAGVAKTSCGSSAPTIVASADYTNINVANCTVTKPTGLAVGDLMIATIFDEQVLTGLTAPSGFTLLHGPLQVGTTQFRRARYYKLADAGDVAASDFTFTRTGNFLICGVGMTAFRGVDQVTPIADHEFQAGSATSTLTFLDATSTKANSLSVAICESGDISTPNLPSGYTNITTVAAQYTRWDYKVLPTAGATGNFTTTMGAPGSWTTSHIIINPP